MGYRIDELTRICYSIREYSWNELHHIIKQLSFVVTKTLIFVSGIHYSDFHISSQSKRNLCFDVLKNKTRFIRYKFFRKFYTYRLIFFRRMRINVLALSNLHHTCWQGQREVEPQLIQKDVALSKNNVQISGSGLQNSECTKSARQINEETGNLQSLSNCVMKLTWCRLHSRNALAETF